MHMRMIGIGKEWGHWAVSGEGYRNLICVLCFMFWRFRDGVGKQKEEKGRKKERTRRKRKEKEKEKKKKRKRKEKRCRWCQENVQELLSNSGCCSNNVLPSSRTQKG
jgi:hypothetical protein